MSSPLPFAQRVVNLLQHDQKAIDEDGLVDR